MRHQPDDSITQAGTTEVDTRPRGRAARWISDLRLNGKRCRGSAGIAINIVAGER